MINQNNVTSFADLAVEHRIVKMPLFERVNFLLQVQFYFKSLQGSGLITRFYCKIFIDFAE